MRRRNLCVKPSLLGVSDETGGTSSVQVAEHLGEPFAQWWQQVFASERIGHRLEVQRVPKRPCMRRTQTFGHDQLTKLVEGQVVEGAGHKK
jgi:hypothetical protein